MKNTVPFHQTVIGYRHIQKNIPCEDHSDSYRDPQGRFDIAIVADGHGDPACFRSERGSRLAVNITMEALITFAEHHAEDLEGFRTVMASARESAAAVKGLTDAIVAGWYRRIMHELEEQPPSEEELAHAPAAAPIYREGKHTEHIYGTTLIACLHLDTHLILFQQGDGRAVVVMADGSVREPVPWDERCHENITTSLCDEDAAASVRSCIIDRAEEPVAAVLLCSDGIEDSYRRKDGAHLFCRRACMLLHDHRYAGYEDSLAERLSTLSREGSTDDMSIAGVIFPAAMQELTEDIRADVHREGLCTEQAELEQKLASMERKRSVLQKLCHRAHEEWEEACAMCRSLEKDIEKATRALAGEPPLPDTEEDAPPSPEEVEQLKLFLESARTTSDEMQEAYEKAEREFHEYDAVYQGICRRLQEIERAVAPRTAHTDSESPDAESSGENAE